MDAGRLHVEEYEEHADEVELDGKALPGRPDGRYAALVRRLLLGAPSGPAEDVGRHQHEDGEPDSHTAENQD